MVRYTGLLRWIIASAIIILCTAICVSANELDLTAKAALLMEASSGQILYAKDIDQPLPVASISKL